VSWHGKCDIDLNKLLGCIRSLLAAFFRATIWSKNRRNREFSRRQFTTQSHPTRFLMKKAMEPTVGKVQISRLLLLPFTGTTCRLWIPCRGREYLQLTKTTISVSPGRMRLETTKAHRKVRSRTDYAACLLLYIWLYACNINSLRNLRLTFPFWPIFDTTTRGYWLLIESVKSRLRLAQDFNVLLGSSDVSPCSVCSYPRGFLPLFAFSCIEVETWVILLYETFAIALTFT